MEIHPNGYWINPEIGVNHHFDQGLADAIVRSLSDNAPAHIVDLGCGPGHYTKVLRDAGHFTIGIDGDPATESLGEGYYCIDLTDYQKFEQGFFGLTRTKADVVLCLEVGEHIPQEKNRLIELICRLEPHTVIISWAVPGQGGDGHVWERPNQEVMADFERYGYELSEELTKRLREAATLWWFKDTLMVFHSR